MLTCDNNDSHIPNSPQDHLRVLQSLLLRLASLHRNMSSLKGEIPYFGAFKVFDGSLVVKYFLLLVNKIITSSEEVIENCIKLCTWVETEKHFFMSCAVWHFWHGNQCLQVFGATFTKRFLSQGWKRISWVWFSLTIFCVKFLPLGHGWQFSLFTMFSYFFRFWFITQPI